MMGDYSRLTRAISVPKKAAQHVAVMDLKHWIMPYSIPNTITASTGLQFVSKVFAVPGASMGTKNRIQLPSITFKQMVKWKKSVRR